MLHPIDMSPAMSCTFEVRLQTFEQWPTTQFPPGGAISGPANCYSFPGSPSITLTTTPTPFTVPFSQFTGATHATPIQSQIVGLQWHLAAGASQAACNVEVRIDDIAFVAQ